jgi:hypothetical protein
VGGHPPGKAHYKAFAKNDVAPAKVHRCQHPAQVSSNLSLIHSRQAAADENLLKHKPNFLVLPFSY